MSELSVYQQVQINRAANLDFEWYPTTDEIIHVIKKDIISNFSHYRSYDEQTTVTESVLDVGAGNGSTLKRLTTGSKYAIEKSRALLASLDSDVFVVGTDFHEQTLIDKKVDIVFCNPPFSEFEHWAQRIISEANCAFVYLVLPVRWRNSESIINAINNRTNRRDIDTLSERQKAHYKEPLASLGEFTFENAERAARARVEVFRVDLSNGMYHRDSCLKDPFKVWFDNEFPIKTGSKLSEYGVKKEIESEADFTINTHLAEQKSIVDALSDGYNDSLQHLLDQYKKITTIDGALLSEMNVCVDAIRAGLALKIQSLKDVYWRHLFHHLDTLTSRLCSKERDSMLDLLMSRTHVDFTPSNAHAVALWCVKNANQYLDSQIVNHVETLVSSANITAYASNKRTFKDENWRYVSNSRSNSPEHYQLDYRVVVESKGGFEDMSKGEVSQSCERLLNDILTIAQTLNFDTEDTTKAGSRIWEAGKKQDFTYFNHTLNKELVLFEARTFMNGNIHIKFNQEYLLALNVTFGRLKGWCKDASHAAREMRADINEVQKHFSHDYLVPLNQVPLLLAS